MKKKFYPFAVLIITSFIIVDLASAGLINYDRRNKTATISGTGGETADIDYSDWPEWAKKPPRVRSRDERKYDVNRDGYLQQAEVKIYLRDVIDKVEDRGGYRVDSGLLKEYDENRDGTINRYELETIRRHLGAT